MKKFLLLLCVIAMLFTMVLFVGCTDDEKTDDPSNTPAQGESGDKPSGDDSILNQDGTSNDDVASDIFDNPHVSDNFQ